MENCCMDLELLFYKHTKYLLNIIQQIIQSRKLKAILTILGDASKNTKKWICMNLRTDQVNYDTKSQVHTTTNARIVNDKSTNQGVKTANDQCHNIHQESISLNTVTESDIYGNYIYTSCINWEIEKTHETHSNKLEFNIDKTETSLMKIDSNIIKNNDEIDDINDNKMVHPSNNLIDDMYNNIDHHNVHQKQTNHNGLYTHADNELQFNSDLEDQMEGVN